MKHILMILLTLTLSCSSTSKVNVEVYYKEKAYQTYKNVEITYQDETSIWIKNELEQKIYIGPMFQFVIIEKTALHN